MASGWVSHAILAGALRELRGPAGPVLLAIDGAGASGKSSIARGLARACPELSVVHVDDFYRPSAERWSGPIAERPLARDFDLERLRREVLEPLRAGGAAAYRPYDWSTDALAAKPVTLNAPVVIVEGIYSMSPALKAFFELSLWVECPRELRLARGLERDGEAARPRWEQDWMPGEDRYIDTERPQDAADLVCDGSRPELKEGVLVLSAPGARGHGLLARLLRP
jgi:uridine kinase